MTQRGATECETDFLACLPEWITHSLTHPELSILRIHKTMSRTIQIPSWTAGLVNSNQCLRCSKRVTVTGSHTKSRTTRALLENTCEIRTEKWPTMFSRTTFSPRSSPIPLYACPASLLPPKALGYLNASGTQTLALQQSPRSRTQPTIRKWRTRAWTVNSNALGPIPGSKQEGSPDSHHNCFLLCTFERVTSLGLQVMLSGSESTSPVVRNPAP